MKVVMPILSVLMCLLFIKNSSAMTTDDDNAAKIVNVGKLLEHWANREEHLLPHVKRAQQDKLHTASYISDDGKLRATFNSNDNVDIVTSYFDNGDTCEVTVYYLYNLLFPPQAFLCDGKIYDRDGNMLEDVSIELGDEKPSRISKFKRYVTTKVTNYVTTKLTRRPTT